MKTLLFFEILSITFGAGCNSVNENTRDFIPGIYCKNFTDSASVVNDTFYIELLTPTGSDQYSVTNKFSYRQTIDSLLQPVSNKVNNWTGSYSEKYKTIVINQTGAVLAFDPKNKEMKLGTVAYKKLSQ